MSFDEETEELILNQLQKEIHQLAEKERMARDASKNKPDSIDWNNITITYNHEPSPYPHNPQEKLEMLGYDQYAETIHAILSLLEVLGMPTQFILKVSQMIQDEYNRK